jgi:hypothetical protein
LSSADDSNFLLAGKLARLCKHFFYFKLKPFPEEDIERFSRNMAMFAGSFDFNHDSWHFYDLPFVNIKDTRIPISQYINTFLHSTQYKAKAKQNTSNIQPENKAVFPMSNKAVFPMLKLRTRTSGRS